MTEQSGEPVGTLAEELAKLMGVVSGLAANAAPGASEGANDGGVDDQGDGVHGESGGNRKADPATDHTEHIANGSAACQVCPVCQTIAFVRSTSPEVRDHLASSAASLAAAARGLLDGVAAQRPEPDDRGSHVENINLSEDEQWD
ncbi:MAG: hypothetical protein L0K86_02365 [Actinomycetia bacterium]|nr:hypothetical protein [Actinomycetes bacterium]